MMFNPLVRNRLILVRLYILIILFLTTFPFDTNSFANNTTILQLRGDYFFHILLFLPWMFFHNTAFGNLRSGRSFWPLALSFWSDGNKTKDKRQKEKGKSTLAKSLSLSLSQQLSWLLTGLLFASTTEGLQYFLPYRAFNINDLLANLLGVMLGFAVLILYHFTTKNRNRR